MDVSDATWARRILPRVSRTFALGIEALPPPWRPWVTASYLLCRIVDTVEDAGDLTPAERRAMFAAFERALVTRDPTAFAALAARLPEDDEGDLARELGRVLHLLDAFPHAVQSAIVHWVGEMARGMDRYATRGLPITLHDELDLEDYCYVVAGTVGHLLTELFASGSASARANADVLHAHAEGFGRLLQLTNIAKDYAVDRARGRSYVPRTWQVDGIDSVNRFVALARANRESASAYVSVLGEAALRRFCLLPLMLADRTLDLVENNPAVLAGSPKLAHADVARVLVEVQSLAADRP